MFSYISRLTRKEMSMFSYITRLTRKEMSMFSYMSRLTRMNKSFKIKGLHPLVTVIYMDQKQFCFATSFKFLSYNPQFTM